MKYRSSIIDSHLHMHGGYGDLSAFYRCMEALASAAGYSGKNVAMVPQWDREFVSQNEIGILYKALYPGTVYAYAGFDYYMPDGVRQADPAEQARRYREMGFDGIKMVELKPTVQRNLGGVWLSDARYDEMFSYLEESGTPLLLHVADPETFWDRDNCPAFARANGWYYGDGDYPAKEALYADAEAVLSAHPRLRVSLAHFYFLSDDIDRAERILRTYPNVWFDLTPGVEMYGNFSKTPDAWRAFFQKYGDRILFGTDNGWGSMTPMDEKIAFAAGNVATQRRFLETADAFTGYDMPLKGIDLPVATLEKIYCRNYQAMAGSQPCPVDIEKAIRYVDEKIRIYEGSCVPFYDRVFPQMREVKALLGGMRL